MNKKSHKTCLWSCTKKSGKSLFWVWLSHIERNLVSCIFSLSPTLYSILQSYSHLFAHLLTDFLFSILYLMLRRTEWRATQLPVIYIVKLSCWGSQQEKILPKGKGVLTISYEKRTGRKIFTSCLKHGNVNADTHFTNKIRSWLFRGLQLPW